MEKDLRVPGFKTKVDEIVQPTRIHQTSSGEIGITWSDGHESVMSLRTVRDACPCAGCKGETVLFKTYIPPAFNTETPGRYMLKAAVPVGNYALKLTWGDGHEMGMYTWEQLRSLCECPACVLQRV